MKDNGFLYMNSRFGKCKDFLELASQITGKSPIITIPEAAPIVPKSLLDILVIAPCTGNTLSKLANGISDTPVLMAGPQMMGYLLQIDYWLRNCYYTL